MYARSRRLYPRPVYPHFLIVMSAHVCFVYTMFYVILVSEVGLHLENLELFQNIKDVVIVTPSTNGTKLLHYCPCYWIFRTFQYT